MYEIHMATKWQRLYHMEPHLNAIQKNWTKDVQIWRRTEASNEFKERGKARKKRHAYKTKTFLTLCPIFGISQISKIHHQFLVVGNPTNKKPRLPSLKKLHNYSPRPTPPVHRLLHPHPNFRMRSTMTRIRPPVRKETIQIRCDQSAQKPVGTRRWRGGCGTRSV